MRRGGFDVRVTCDGVTRSVRALRWPHVGAATCIPNRCPDRQPGARPLSRGACGDVLRVPLGARRVREHRAGNPIQGRTDADASTMGERLADAVPAHRGAGRVYGPVSYTHLRAHETPEHLVC